MLKVRLRSIDDLQHDMASLVAGILIVSYITRYFGNRSWEANEYTKIVAREL